MSDDELFEDTSVCFIHRHKLSLNQYDLGVHSFKINYDRCNHGLVGMNILSSMLCITAPSEHSNKTVFIGVSDSQPNKSSFYEALEIHFRMISLGMAEIDDNMVKNRASGFNEFLKFFIKSKR